MNRHIIAGITTAALALCACGGPAKQNDLSAPDDRTPVSQSADSASDLKKISLVLDWAPNTNHTGFYTARDLGYYQEAGLAVEIVQPPEDGATSLVAAGKADFGIDAQDTIAPAFALEEPLPVTAVAALIQHNTSGIISRRGEGIDHPGGLTGKTYATWNNPVEQAMLKNVVEADGGDYSQITMIPNNITDEAAALQMDATDAIWVFYGWSGISAELRGVETDYFDFCDYNETFDYYTPILVANNEFLARDPAAVKAFLAATAKGYEYAVGHPEEAAALLCKAEPSLDPKLVVASQRWLADRYKANVSQWGYIDGRRWNRFYRWLGENHLTERPIPDDFGFSNAYLP